MTGAERHRGQSFGDACRSAARVRECNASSVGVRNSERDDGAFVHDEEHFDHVFVPGHIVRGDATSHADEGDRSGPERPLLPARGEVAVDGAVATPGAWRRIDDPE